MNDQSAALVDMLLLVQACATLESAGVCWCDCQEHGPGDTGETTCVNCGHACAPRDGGDER